VIRTVGTLLAAAVAAALLSGTAAAQDAAEPVPAPPEPYVVRLGYTTFDRPDVVRRSSTLHSVKWYLDEIAKKSAEEPWKRPLRFELALGNYYQIWSWFRTGQIDAAIVSPFVAMLLERDRQAISVLEFSEGADPAAHYPVVSATGLWSKKPIEGVDQYLQALLDIAGAEEPKPGSPRAGIKEIRERFRFDLVAHLSSSGFVMPALYAQEWLDNPDRAVDEEVRRRFWHLFFENAHLTLAHDGTHAELPISTIKFSYDRGQPSREPFGDWHRYQVGTRLPLDVPIIPNDVLIIRRQVAEETLGAGAMDRARLGELLTSPEIQERFKAREGKYGEVRLFNPDVQDRFRQEVNRLFGSTELKPLDARWFDQGLFDFTIDETMAFLQQDQENSGISRLSVVLSGGGVKSLYQTVLLDHLYGHKEGSSRKLRNYDEAPHGLVGPTPSHSAGPLTVHTFIGTSGGAMLAFFAAQMPEIGPLQKIVEETSRKPLFPGADLPRLLSILVLLSVLWFVLLIAKTFNWWGCRDEAAEAVQKSRSLRLMTIELLLVIAGAAVIVSTRSEYMETVPMAEAIFFILTGVAVHFGLTCIVCIDGAPAPRHKALGRLALLMLIFGIQLVLIAIAARHLLGPAPAGLHEVRFPVLSVLASAGVFMMAAGVAAGAAAGRWSLAVQRARPYVAALTTILIVIALSFLALIVLTLADLGTLLELTGLYWAGLFISAIAASVGVLYFARKSQGRPAGFLRHGFAELMRDRRGVVTTTMATTILGIFAFCVAWWGLLVAPAVYSNVKAVKAFGEALTPDQLWKNRFRSNLVVTGTLLRKTDCSPNEAVDAGGLYFCFEGTEGCGTPDHDHWKVFRRPAPARAVDAVFASGSAFPVFPPHRAHLPNGCEVRLVDGGYAHNVPLEAASMSEARQVLILNASPDPAEAELAELEPQPGWKRFLQQAQLEGGQLFRASPDVLSFMFARAQELDRSIGGDLVVASLTPRPEDGWWPFLLDFRESVRTKMIEAANQDIQRNRRIGHVLSWGRPILLHKVILVDEESARKRSPNKGSDLD